MNSAAVAPQQAPTQDSPMARRLQATQSNPVMVLYKSLEALQGAPEHIRKEYAPVLVRAQMMAEKKQKGGV